MGFVNQVLPAISVCLQHVDSHSEELGTRGAGRIRPTTANLSRSWLHLGLRDVVARGCRRPALSRRTDSGSANSQSPELPVATQHVHPQDLAVPHKARTKRLFRLIESETLECNVVGILCGCLRHVFFLATIALALLGAWQVEPSCLSRRNTLQSQQTDPPSLCQLAYRFLDTNFGPFRPRNARE